MKAYVFGAGASFDAGYPLASQLLQRLSVWLNGSTLPEPWAGNCRNRILQLRETFGSLDDFESILGRLEEFGYERVKPTGLVTYKQNPNDVVHDCQQAAMGKGNVDLSAVVGFYPQYLRSDLISAYQEFF
jgi:hypothetical protein